MEQLLILPPEGWAPTTTDSERQWGFVYKMIAKEGQLITGLPEPPRTRLDSPSRAQLSGTRQKCLSPSLSLKGA